MTLRRALQIFTGTDDELLREMLKTRAFDVGCRTYSHGIPAANWPVMLDVTLSILALIAGGVVLELFASAPAASDLGVKRQIGENVRLEDPR